MKFLYKVSARNIFRYKKRMFMMILGIGGCAALVLAGFGINDSIAGISDHQYDNIEKYDTTVAFEEPITEKDRKQFENKFGDELSNIAVLQQTSVNVEGPKSVKSTNLMITGDQNITEAVSFKLEEANVDMPGRGEALLTNKIAEVIGVKVGDQIVIEYDDIETVTLTVSGIYRNYVGNYIYITDETYEKDFTKSYEPNVMYVTARDESKVRDVSEGINDFDGVVGVYLIADQRAGIDNMMLSLNYIIILVIILYFYRLWRLLK
jgi:putative ABC transport system permease protein